MVAYDLSRPLWGTRWLRVRTLDHGLKLVAVYFGMASAGAGNLLPGLRPWGQIVPNVLGVLVMLGFALAAARRSAAARLPVPMTPA